MKHESWSDYWRLGEPTTLNFFRDGYTGELAAFWHRQVDALPQAARVLDLATGNGAVAVAVLRRARALGRALEIEGVDVAQIDPATHAGKQPQLREELQAIRFHPGTPAERTGLPAASYHLVTSQYGIEYGDLDASVTEIARLLRRGGSFAAILHSTDSNVAQTATRIDALLGLLLDELDLPGLMRRLLAALGDVRAAADLAQARQDAGVAAPWAELGQGIARARAFAAPDEPMRGTLRGFLQRLLAPMNEQIALAPSEKQDMLDQLATTSRNLQQRMAALRTSALEPAALERFLDRLREAGLVAEPVQHVCFGPQREAMGYGVVARRAD